MHVLEVRSLDACGLRAAVVHDLVREPGERYRARYDAHGSQAITRRAERRVAREQALRLQRLLQLAAQLRGALSGDALALWLQLEEAIHAYWGEVAAAHYDLGVTEPAEAPGATRRAAAGRLRTLARALERIADDLE